MARRSTSTSNNILAKSKHSPNTKFLCLFIIFQNHIPLEVKEGVIHVLGCAQIEPPFAATSVVCENNLIRKRVRDLLLELV